jgi:hypothetical protein
LAGLRIEAEGIHALCHRVDVIQRALIEAPVQSVGEGDVTHHACDGVVRVQPVERTGARARIEGHAAGPEAAGRIALAVIHPVG